VTSQYSKLETGTPISTQAHTIVEHCV